MNQKAKEKLLQTNTAKYGSYEAWKDHLRTIAKKGGTNGTGKSKIHHTREGYSKIGKIGRSKREQNSQISN